MTGRDFNGDDASPRELPPEGRRVVAVIGIDRYRHWPALDNAVSDAHEASALFRRLGFEEIAPPLTNEMATRDAIDRLVRDDLSRLDSSDSLVLFFAGHGHSELTKQTDGAVQRGFLVPVNGELPGDRTSSWLRVDHWLSDIAHLRVRHVLVILDACRSGIALRWLPKFRSGADSDAGSLDALRRRQSRRVITSALDDQQAQDGGPVSGHSLFTACLIEALDGGLERDGKWEATGSDIGRYVQTHVTRFSQKRQTPDFGAFELDDRGELIIRIGKQPQATRTDEHAGAATERDRGLSVDTLRDRPIDELPKLDTPTFLGRTAKEWERDLQSTNESERREAAWALGQMGPAAIASLPALFEAVRASEPSLELVTAIGRLAGDDRALLPLARSLAASDERARAKAAELLADRRERALDILLRAFDDPKRRPGACLALSRIGRPAVQPLLQRASSSEFRYVTGDIEACIGAMDADGHLEAIRCAREMPGVTPLVMGGLDRAALVTQEMADFAIEVWSKHFSESCDRQASVVALHSAGDPGVLLPIAAAALRADSNDTNQRVGRALAATGDTGIAVLRGLLAERYRPLWQNLGPAITSLGDRAARLATELVEAWNISREALFRETIMRLCPAQASPGMLHWTLEHDLPRCELALGLLIAAGAEGLGAVLACIGCLGAALRKQAEEALNAAARDATLIVASVARYGWQEATLEFCANVPGYAAAAAPRALALLHSHEFDSDWRLQNAAEKVLSAAPEATLRAATSPSHAFEVLRTWRLIRVIAALKQPLDTFASLAPQLDDPLARGRVLKVLELFPRHLWNKAEKAGTLAALDRLREPEAIAMANRLRRSLGLDRMGRWTRAAHGLGFPAVFLVSVIGGALLLPLGVIRSFRHSGYVVLTVLGAAGVGFAAQHYVFSATPVILFMSLVVANAEIGLGAGTAACMVHDAVDYDPEPANIKDFVIAAASAWALAGLLSVVTREYLFGIEIAAALVPVAIAMAGGLIAVMLHRSS